MKPFNRSVVMSLAVAVLSLMHPLVAQAIPITPTGGAIKDLALHNVDTTSLDSATGIRILPGQSSDTWTIQLTNGSTNTSWTDFHVEILPRNVNSLPAQFGSVRISGFSLTSPVNLRTSGGGNLFGNHAQANLAPNPAVGTVPPGSSITLSVDVNNNFVFLRADYFLGVQPTARPFPMPAAPKNKGRSDGSTVAYDVSLQRLSFTGHQMVDTGFPNDPILMADVNIPDFVLEGQLGAGEFLFRHASSSPFSISDSTGIFMQATTPFLTYLPSSNSFYGEMTDFEFLGVQSQWIAEFANLFDPSSPNFDPELRMYFTYDPGGNLLGLTQSFTTSGMASNGTDGVFAAQAIPEPSTLTLVGLGTLSLLSYGWRRRKWAGATKDGK